MKEHRIIALTGAEGVGKDTFYELFHSVLRRNASKKSQLSMCGVDTYERRSFADPIWRMVAVLLKSDVNSVRSPEKKNKLIREFEHFSFMNKKFSYVEDAEKDKPFGVSFDVKTENVTLRSLCITIAETFKELFGEKVWVKYLLDSVGNQRTIITDLRFNVEYEALKKLNVTFVRIIRVDEMGRRLENNEYEMGSVPDSELDYILYNKGNKDDFEKAIEEMIKKLNIEPFFDIEVL